MSKLIAEDPIERHVGRNEHGVSDLYRRPNDLGGSFELLIFDKDRIVVVELTVAWLVIPANLDGLKLVEVAAGVYEPDSTGVELMVRNATTVQDMLSTALTIDSGDRTSYGAGVPAVIDPAQAVVSRADYVEVDVSDATDALGLEVILVFG